MPCRFTAKMEPTLLHPNMPADLIPQRELNNAMVQEDGYLPPVPLADMKKMQILEKMSESCESHLPHQDGYLRVLDTYEKVLEFILAEEKATGMHFIGHRKEGIFDRLGKKMERTKFIC